MRVLIISNGAPGYHRFFNRLVPKFQHDGHSVEIAVDCPYHAEANELVSLGVPAHDFSAFFAESSIDEAVLQRYGDFNVNGALLSDYERAQVYDIGRHRDPAYYRRLQCALLNFFENIILHSKIDVVLYENVSNAFAHFAWIVCQRLEVSYRGLVGSRLPGRYAMVDGPCDEHRLYAENVAAIQKGELIVASEVRAWCHDYLCNLESIVPDYMKFNNLDNLKLAGRYVNAKKAGKFLRAWRHRNDDHHHAFQIGHPLWLSWAMVWRNLRRKLRISSCARFYSKPVEGESFLLYPIHYHPESSTSVLAGAYLDEYEVIRNIAFSLPAGKYLYVKDHVSAYGYPGVDFYRRVSSLPNVRLLSPFENTKQLIRECAAVITLTSTVGYEALLLGKRVFLYGAVFYQFHPNVVRVENPARLFELLATFLDAPLSVDGDYNADFLAGYYLGTYAGVLNFNLDDGQLDKLVDVVYPVLLQSLSSRQIRPLGSPRATQLERVLQ